MTKQEEENAPGNAPAESRAAPPPVVLGYSAPRQDRRPQSTIGQISIVFGVMAMLIVAAQIAISLVGSAMIAQAQAILGILFLLFLLCGAVCGIIGVCQRKQKKTTAIIGLVVNGLGIALTLLLLLLAIVAA